MPNSKMISAFQGKEPRIAATARIDISARIIGDVILDEEVSVWPMAVLRADSGSIRLEPGSAVLDLALVEAPSGFDVTVGREAVVSHKAVIHGASIQPQALVGIGAIVLDGAVVSTGSIIGAGCVVPPGMVVPPGSLVLGLPGKVVRSTTPRERATIVEQAAELREKSDCWNRGAPA